MAQNALNLAKLGQFIARCRLALFGAGVGEIFLSRFDLRLNLRQIELLNGNGFFSQNDKALIGHINKAATHKQALAMKVQYPAMRAIG